MYRQCRCLYRYTAYIFNIGTYSDPYTSIGATLIYIYIYINYYAVQTHYYHHHHIRMSITVTTDDSTNI